MSRITFEDQCPSCGARPGQYHTDECKEPGVRKDIVEDEPATNPPLSKSVERRLKVQRKTWTGKDD